jgi:hypothetical protein
MKLNYELSKLMVELRAYKCLDINSVEILHDIINYAQQHNLSFKRRVYKFLCLILRHEIQISNELKVSLLWSFCQYQAYEFLLKYIKVDNFDLYEYILHHQTNNEECAAIIENISQTTGTYFNYLENLDQDDNIKINYSVEVLDSLYRRN